MSSTIWLYDYSSWNFGCALYPVNPQEPFLTPCLNIYIILWWWVLREAADPILHYYCCCCSLTISHAFENSFSEGIKDFSLISDVFIPSPLLMCLRHIPILNLILNPKPLTLRHFHPLWDYPLAFSVLFWSIDLDNNEYEATRTKTNEDLLPSPFSSPDHYQHYYHYTGSPKGAKSHILLLLPFSLFSLSYYLSLSLQYLSFALSFTISLFLCQTSLFELDWFLCWLLGVFGAGKLIPLSLSLSYSPLYLSLSSPSSQVLLRRRGRRLESEH